MGKNTKRSGMFPYLSARGMFSADPFLPLPLLLAGLVFSSVTLPKFHFLSPCTSFMLVLKDIMCKACESSASLFYEKLFANTQAEIKNVSQRLIKKM